jgi:hypothetical protein
MASVYFVVTYVDSLRGHEGLPVDLRGLRLATKLREGTGCKLCNRAGSSRPSKGRSNTGNENIICYRSLCHRSLCHRSPDLDLKFGDE